MPEKDCEDCGSPLGNVHHNKLYCPSCKDRRRSHGARVATRKYRAANPPEKAPMVPERICRNCRQLIALRKGKSTCWDCKALRKELSPIVFRLRNPDYHKEWVAKQGKDYARDVSLRNNYGISQQDYNSMAASQGNRCKICGKEPTWKANGGRLVVDHCHRSGKIRNLLCPSCNRGIGQFFDNPTFLRAAADYIEESKRADS